MHKLKLLRKAYLTKYWRNYYSQFGEDAVLRELIGRKRNGIYIDVGCYHPKKFSNTHFLRKLGWSGINVDLEDDKIFLFKTLRPDDHNVVSAVSDLNKEVLIFKDREYSLGTTIEPNMIPDEIKPSVERVRTRTLNSIIAESKFNGREIDLLSIDAEGHDFNVLRSIDLAQYKPKIIVIEDQSKNIEDILSRDLYKHLRKQKYKLTSWVHLSLIFTLDA